MITIIAAIAIFSYINHIADYTYRSWPLAGRLAGREDWLYKDIYREREGEMYRERYRYTYVYIHIYIYIYIVYSIL